MAQTGSSPPESSQVIHVPQLPLSLDLANYKDAYSNANPNGDMLAAQKFQQLVDSVQEMSGQFVNAPSSIESTYGLIVNGASYSEGNNFLAGVINKARFGYKSSAQAQFAGHGEWRIVETIPNDWYLDKKSMYKKARIPLDKKGVAPEGLDFLGGRSSPSTLTVGDERLPLSENTRFTHCVLEYMLVRFVRPWMDFTLFGSSGWWLSGQEPGYCSSGQSAKNAGILPFVSTGMIIVRSAHFEGKWDPADQKRIDDGRKANKNIFVGPYKLLSNSDAVSKVNVAAWISELVPFSPKNNKPVEGSIKVNNKGGFVAKFSVTWKINGKSKTKKTDNFPVLSNEIIKIPANATDITVKIDIMTFISVWSNVKTIQLKKPEVREYELSGTTFKPKFKEVYTNLVLKGQEKPSQFVFLVSIGFIIYYLCNLPFTVLANILDQMEGGRILRYIQPITSIILYSLISLGFLWEKNRSHT